MAVAAALSCKGARARGPAPMVAVAAALSCKGARARDPPANMAANPALVQAAGGLYPAPYQGEYIALGRDGTELELKGVRTSSGK